MKCLLLINTSSGNAQRAIKNRELHEVLHSLYGDITEKHITEYDRDYDIAKECEGYDALAVCGGDGTFNNAINAVRYSDVDLLYIPCGTFNDAAHTLKYLTKLEGLNERRIRQIDLGEFNGRLFSYVAAAGSFTAIGFLPKSKFKKLFKRLVYYLYAFKEYRVHNMKAEINADGRIFKDTYTLIMALKSKYVFGFNFNRLFRHNSGKGHLLLIKSPTGVFKLVKMFFLFFRAFFIGFNKEKTGKHIQFIEFTKATIKLDKAYDFCVDGECMRGKMINDIQFHHKKTKIFIPL